MRPFEQIADRIIAGPVSWSERVYISELCEAPTEDFKRLVQILDAEGCEFPRQQAALMLRNTPGVARRLLEQ